MGYAGYPLEDMEGNLVWLSRWIDQYNIDHGIDPEAITWGRLAKIAEEHGEVISAFIGVTAQNPRKGYSHSREQVKKELLDVVVTALGAWEHMDGHTGRSLHALKYHIDALVERARKAEVERA